MDWDPVIRRLVSAVEAGKASALPLIADAVENLLYRNEVQAHPDERLRTLARSLAAAPQSSVRKMILYFAGSPVRFETPTPTQVAFRDALLQILVANEDGGTLDTLVWKLGESATERGKAAERLLELCRRFGTDRIATHLHIAVLAGGEGVQLREGLQGLLIAAGLPGLPEDDAASRGSRR